MNQKQIENAYLDKAIQHADKARRELLKTMRATSHAFESREDGTDEKKTKTHYALMLSLMNSALTNLYQLEAELLRRTR